MMCHGQDSASQTSATPAAGEEVVGATSGSGDICRQNLTARARRMRAEDGGKPTTEAGLGHHKQRQAEGRPTYASTYAARAATVDIEGFLLR